MDSKMSQDWEKTASKKQVIEFLGKIKHVYKNSSPDYYNTATSICDLIQRKSSLSGKLILDNVVIPTKYWEKKWKSVLRIEHSSRDVLISQDKPTSCVLFDIGIILRRLNKQLFPPKISTTRLSRTSNLEKQVLNSNVVRYHHSDNDTWQQEYDYISSQDVTNFYYNVISNYQNSLLSTRVARASIRWPDAYSSDSFLNKTVRFYSDTFSTTINILTVFESGYMSNSYSRHVLDSNLFPVNNLNLIKIAAYQEDNNQTTFGYATIEYNSDTFIRIPYLSTSPQTEHLWFNWAPPPPS
jgi:hypothetical protein